MQAPLNNINEYDFSALEAIQPKGFDLSEVLREMLFYSLPLLSFGFFLLIVFGAILPSIQEISTKGEQIESLKDQDAKILKRIEAIRALGNNNAEVDAILEKIDTIIPTGQTEVVKFNDRIESNVLSHGLKSTSSVQTNEQMVQVAVMNQGTSTTTGGETKANPETSLPFMQIPTQFDIQGTFGNIRNFFSDMYKGQDFFVVERMELNASTGEIWSGHISLVKYQFSPSDKFDRIKAFGNISEKSLLNQQVMTYIKEKFFNNAIEATPTP